MIYTNKITPIELTGDSFVDVVMNDMTEEERKNIKVDTNNLFINSSHTVLTRQGIWKIVKYYISKVSIKLK